jgi:hypothetical protein
MRLTIAELRQFAAKYGKLEVSSGKQGAAVITEDGSIDASDLLSSDVAEFIELRATRYSHNGKRYSRREFELIVRRSRGELDDSQTP